MFFWYAEVWLLIWPFFFFFWHQEPVVVRAWSDWNLFPLYQGTVFWEILSVSICNCFYTFKHMLKTSNFCCSCICRERYKPNLLFMSCQMAIDMVTWWLTSLSFSQLQESWEILRKLKDCLKHRHRQLLGKKNELSHPFFFRYLHVSSVTLLSFFLPSQAKVIFER